jgi:hypothetical protein
VDKDRTEEDDATAADNEAAEDADETVEDDKGTRVGLLEFAFELPAKRAASGDGEKRPVGSMCGGARTGVGTPGPVTA